MVQPPWNTVCQFLKKLNINLQYNSAIPLLGIYRRNENACPHKDMHTNIHRTIIPNGNILNVHKLRNK